MKSRIPIQIKTFRIGHTGVIKVIATDCTRRWSWSCSKLPDQAGETVFYKVQYCGSGSVLDPYSGALWIRIHTLFVSLKFVTQP